ncbi:hypothetical protein [Myxococcus xanthus]|uniref:hypothetical protein n=1 Tax=Myxococcus xanthus TaxID=34 RepID=UPI00148DA154|nr:hypothetical protein [Myxococcus xanthus]NOJ85305.1 hypothetical protein [Myxococcus xanthus]
MPKPKSLNEILPGASAESAVITADVSLYFKTDDNSHRFSKKLETDPTWISIKDPLFQAGNDAAHYARFIPPLPQEIKLAYTARWHLLHSATVTGQSTYTYKLNFTEGTEKTTAESFSAQLGASYEGLSATLSHTLSTSVTVSTSMTTEQMLSFEVPKNGVTVVAVWQLVQTFLLVDEDGKPFTYPPGGIWRITDNDGDGNQASVSFPLNERGVNINTMTLRSPMVYLDKTNFS